MSQLTNFYRCITNCLEIRWAIFSRFIDVMSNYTEQYHFSSPMESKLSFSGNLADERVLISFISSTFTSRPYECGCSCCVQVASSPNGGPKGLWLMSVFGFYGLEIGESRLQCTLHLNIHFVFGIKKFDCFARKAR